MAFICTFNKVVVVVVVDDDDDNDDVKLLLWAFTCTMLFCGPLPCTRTVALQ